MNLNALILCPDDKIMRVLRRVLSDLEVGIENCTDADSAVRRLTRGRFEAVVVDCVDEAMAAKVLSSVRSAPCNKRAIAVAMIDGQKAVQSAFALGAHFVFYKPISYERARTSFRAALALMKCERRRNVRVPIEFPVTLFAGADQQGITTLDISEGGMAVRVPRPARKSHGVRIKFTLPGTEHVVDCAAEVAWKNPGSQTGVRFLDLSRENRQQLKTWLARHSPEIEPDDPPASCKLSDISAGACYLEINAPFPARTRVVLTMRMGEQRFSADGIVRVMHPEAGMGVEFTRHTEEQWAQTGKFVQAMQAGTASPEFTVLPEGMEDEDISGTAEEAPPETDDPLLTLFRRSAEFTSETFREELRTQRRAGSASQAASAAG
ncbi:MAG: PilZ domain-containing protein [Terriglobales bacterium]